MHEVLTGKVWRGVAKRAHAAPTRRAAIAYVTVDELQLRAGDVLVTDASRRAIKYAQTDAKLLRRLHMDGVAIHSRPGLHSKVALFGRYEVVGSANMSGSGLIEVSMITDDPLTTSGIAAFIKRLATKPTRLNKTQIDKLCAIKVVRAGGFKPEKVKNPVRRLGKSIWLVGTKELKHEPNEKTQKRIDRRMRELKRDDDPEWIQWGKKSRFGLECRAGDTLIVIFRPLGSGRPSVTRRVRVLLKDKEPVFNRFYTETPPRAADEVGWARFKRILKAAGFDEKVTLNSVRRLEPEMASAIDRKWTRVP